MTPDLGSFRESVRSVTVSYPIPFLFAALLGFSLACLGVGLLAHGALFWASLCLGICAAVLAFGLGVYGILVRPELMRSERHMLMQRALDVLGDDALPHNLRASVRSEMKKMLGEPAPSDRTRRKPLEGQPNE